MTDPTDSSTSLDSLATLAKQPAAKIVRYLVDHPDSYFGQIQEATDVPTATATRYLAELEAHGFIVGDIPSELRRGRSVRYTVNAERIGEALDQARRELLE